eukprot:1037683-Pelagomonas_calceolata.AAC.8
MSEDRCLYACMCTVIDDHQHIHTHNLPESKAAIETDKMATIYRHGTLAFHLAAGRFWSAALSAYKGCPNAPPLKMGKMGSLIAWPKPGSFNCETKNTADEASRHDFARELSMLIQQSCFQPSDLESKEEDHALGFSVPGSGLLFSASVYTAAKCAKPHEPSLKCPICHPPCAKPHAPAPMSYHPPCAKPHAPSPMR